MKICWDTLEKIRINSKGNLTDGKNIYIEIDACKKCGEPFLSTRRDPLDMCCSKSCRIFSDGYRLKLSMALMGRQYSKESLAKMSLAQKGKNNPMYGRKLSEDHKRRISNSLSGRFVGKLNPMYGVCGMLNPNWRGGITKEKYDALVVENAILKQKLKEATKHDNFGL